ncbi:hypothetical protein [Alkalibacillus almallahensis]|uniref:hypothetical protein n=1 Tax=Alkalibacillus almallahensis TaxID=1379154 RepID=UPI001422C710|nr:hypothetical protein [Alkalibacillus almallahensis]NIK11656.1 hypothetical protein [Alkalibacillus almallahensis]
MYLPESDLKQMRTKQILVTNALFILLMAIFVVLVTLVDMRMTLFFLVLGVSLLSQSIVGFIKKQPIKSLVPIFNRVANYEQQKLGDEWEKQRKIGHFTNLLVSMLMLFQAYIYHGSKNYYIQMDIIIWAFLLTLFLVVINISMIIHIRKVDRASTKLEFKGYSWRSFLVAFVLAFILVFVIIAFIIIYAVSIS